MSHRNTLSLFRHPGESRDPIFRVMTLPSSVGRTDPWVPAFAGMTGLKSDGVRP